MWQNIRDYVSSSFTWGTEYEGGWKLKNKINGILYKYSYSHYFSGKRTKQIHDQETTKEPRDSRDTTQQ